MGCEPRGCGWAATVEVCSARVTRLVTDLKNHEKFSTRQLVPGTLERPRAGMLANPSMRLVPGTLERPRAGMLANPSMRLVPGTLERPRAGMLANPSMRLVPSTGAWHLGESPQECWQIR